MSLSKENKVIIDGQTYYGGLNQPNLKFIKVNVDCWERIFDFLALRDILAMSQTCQRMRQIGGHYFRENFHGTECYLCVSSSPNIFFAGYPVEREDFLRFVDTVRIGYKLEPLRTVSKMGLLSSLTTLRFYEINLNERDLFGFENIQSSIEYVCLERCPIEDDSICEFLASCPKLTSLRFCGIYFKTTATKVKFLQQKFPKLEHFDCLCQAGTIELISFLEQNPNIKCLQIVADELRTIPLNTTTIRLDYLNIDIREDTNDSVLGNRLKTLHANSFFKKLRLLVDDSYDGFDREMFLFEMISFSALEVLETTDYFTHTMNDLTQLKELHLHLTDWQQKMDLEPMAKNLIYLERLRISGSVNQLSSFLRHSKKLKFVFFENRCIKLSTWNLFNLNRSRQMAEVRRRVCIGVNEYLYMRTKWNRHNQNCDLIEITRAEKIRKYFFNKRV